MVKLSSHTKIAIETVLLKLLQVRPGMVLDQIIHKLDALARQIGKTSPDPVYEKTAQTASSGVHEHLSARQSVCIPGGSPPVSVPENPVYTESEAQTREPAKTWQGFLTRIETTLPYLSALLSKGEVKEPEPGILEVFLHNCSAFDKNRLETKQQELKKDCQTFLGKQLHIQVVSQTRALPQAAPEKPDFKAMQAALHHPLVKEAQQIFNGEIINY